MVQSPRIYSLSSSCILVFFLCFFGFSNRLKAQESFPIALQEPVISFSDSIDKVIYKAGVDVMKKHFSGLIVFKHVPKDTSIRIVYLSEVGLTLFDMEYKEDKFKMISCMEALNKPAFIAIFEQFFRMLLKSPLDYGAIEECENGNFRYIQKPHIHKFFVFDEQLVKLSFHKRCRVLSKMEVEYLNEKPIEFSFTTKKGIIDIDLKKIENALK